MTMYSLEKPPKLNYLLLMTASAIYRKIPGQRGYLIQLS